MKSLLSNILIKLNILAVLFLLLSYISVFINPNNFWPLAIFGLLYPLILGINILFALFWAIHLNFRFLISLVVILAGWPFLARNIQFSFPFQKKQVNVEHSNAFTIMSYNVRLFNLYKWTDIKDADDKIFSFINTESPDIVCFQEFYTKNKGNLSEKKIQERLSSLKYKHIKYTFQKKGISNFGIATYSKYPVIHRGEIDFSGSFNHCIYSDLKIGNDTIRVYNLHLQSYRLLKENYEFLDSLKFTYNKKQVRGFRNITYRIKTAYLKRGIQADTVSMHILKSPYPVIVCGDFNDSPVSYTYQKISANLKDAFLESGTGLGSTYSGRFPSYRIDYILHNPQLSCYQYANPKMGVSDHQPVICKMYKKKK